MSDSAFLCERLWTRWLPLLLEEVTHKGCTFFLEDAGSDLRARMQRFGSEATEAPLRVGSSVDEAAELTPREGSRAHHTRLYGDV